MSMHGVRAGGRRERLSPSGKVGGWMQGGGRGPLGQESGRGWHTGWESQFCTLWLCKVFNSSGSHLVTCMDGEDLGLAWL